MSHLTPAIFFRRSLTNKEELAAMEKYFPVSDNLVGINDSLVVARYSAVPFAHEVSKGLALQGSRLVNSLLEHQYIANFDYYETIKDLTPKTWFRLSDAPKDGGPFVVKGVTNSRKHQWNTHMFARDWETAGRVAAELEADMFLGSQPLIFREYVPLVTLEIGIGGLPLANEWRCFYYGTTRLSHCFYWTEAETQGQISEAGLAVADSAAARLAKHTTFFTVDIAERVSGGWTVIEVNDGQMAGLSMNDPEILFKRLKVAMDWDPRAKEP